MIEKLTKLSEKEQAQGIFEEVADLVDKRDA